MRRRPSGAWRYLLMGGATAGVLAVVSSMGLGWLYSERLLNPNPSRRPGYYVEVLDSGARNVKLSPTTDATRGGTYGLEWAGGYGQVGRILHADESGVTREFRSFWGIPKRRDVARLDAYAFPTTRGEPSG